MVGMRRRLSQLSRRRGRRPTKTTTDDGDSSALDVGFSWCCVVLYKLASDGGLALFLAPTAAAIGKLAGTTPRRTVRVSGRPATTLFLSSDGDFCPSPHTDDLYEILGCQVHHVKNTHALSGRASFDLIIDITR